MSSGTISYNTLFDIMLRGTTVAMTNTATSQKFQEKRAFPRRVSGLGTSHGGTVTGSCIDRIQPNREPLTGLAAARPCWLAA